MYYVQEGVASPCEGTGQWLERYYNANARFMGATLPAGERIEFYLARDQETLTELGCPPGATGCTPGTTIYSNFAVYPHEIVHANASLVGTPPPLFQEGLAVVLGCGMSWDTRGPLDTSDPIEQLVEAAAFNDWRDANGFGLYSASASFVRYLVDRFGSSRFMSFYARAPGTGDRQEIEEVFQAEMAESLDAALADWRTKPPQYQGDVCLRLMECDPSMPVLVDTELTLGCGPIGDTTQQGAILRFEVPKERILQITTEPDQAQPAILSTVGFYRCGGGDAIGFLGRTAGVHLDADHNITIDPAQPGSAFALDVPPGDYVAWFTATGETRIHVGVEERKSPMRDASCQAAEEPLALDDTHQTTLTSRWIERTCAGPWCPGQSWDVAIGMTGGALEAQAIVVNHVADLSPHELYLCSDLCPEDTSNCEVLALDTELGVPARSKQIFAPGAVVHVGASAAPFAGYSAVRLRVAPE